MRLFVAPGDEIYEGMVVGLGAWTKPDGQSQKTKQLTNIRAAGSDENVILTPALRMTLEQSLEFIADDELVEITPDALRVLQHLKEHERRLAAKGKAA